ncbi:MAG: hypothetical protein HY725_22700 [Candidatus Rokubacteria bacterium]|nr:hypothetical protein [Candidatus Rokubacteria bacterium]
MKPARWLWVAWLATALVGEASAQESVRLTLDPAMAKGSPTAGVTIVEFSDYQ